MISMHIQAEFLPDANNFNNLSAETKTPKHELKLLQRSRKREDI